MHPSEFDAMARVQARHWWYGALRGLTRQHLAEMTSNRPTILDAGCGTGAQLSALAASGVVIATDVNPYALQHAQGACLVCADGRGLPIASGTFDAVLSFDVLCHEGAGEPLEHLREAWRVLRPGGVLLVNLPAYPWMFSAHDRAVSNARRFRRAEVISLMSEAGFSIERATHWNLLLLPAAHAKRFLARHPGSDLSRAPGIIEQIAGRAATALERTWLRFAPLPAGLSIFVVSRKPTGAVHA